MSNTQHPKTIYVNKILPLSFVDGPGCRSAVFLQGCNVRCVYCHNPETQNKCCNCGECVVYCYAGALQNEAGKIRYYSERCVQCDECIRHCRHNSSPKVGAYTPYELLEIINRNAIFIDGVTFSGGECTLQSEALIDFCDLARHKTALTILIDSNCCFSVATRDKLLAATDGFLADFKCLDSDLHDILVGVGNAAVCDNIAAIAAADKLTELRSVIVPGYNDNSAGIIAMAQFVEQLHGAFVWRLIGFRNFGVRGALADTPALDCSVLNELAAIARKYCTKKIITV